MSIIRVEAFADNPASLLVHVINGRDGEALVFQPPRHIRAHPANTDKSNFIHTSDELWLAANLSTGGNLGLGYFETGRL
jgi:hypothetical protein